ncbi:RagB/SusD family nutrient uptake outer membrane protein [Maribacter sp. 2304DJ31-5]|uniref:RagB/SusD family nutrient uptake outer membrane protein n=1 Tax=Maribacter sp. 2304DJ31-5 TaxID=3386273 RepID=UPI0039BCF2D8
MKSYKILFNLALLTVISFGCENQLEVAPISNIGADSFFNTESDIEQAVVAAYDALQDEGQYGFDYMFLMEIRADDAFVESPTNSGGAQGDIDLFQMSSDNFRIRDAWNSCFRGIQRCNIVLNRIEEVEIDQSLKSTRIGEVKFLRALTYFNLVRLWGDVPLVLEETADPFDAFNIGRSPVSVVYDQIIIDLTEAIAVLPNSNEEGRANKAAAQATLGKVHLTMGNWGDAVTVLQQVSGFSLQPNFADNFGIANENGIESIFEVQFQAGNGEGSPYPNQVAPVGSAAELLNGIGIQRGENIPTNMLYDSFEPGDLRRDISIGTLSNGVTRYASKLIDIPVADEDSDLNFIVIRYADVLLMLAEALNEQGYVADGEAFDLINQIRNRAGLASITSVELPDQISFRDAVLDERRHEFVSENQRWFDLVRTGRAVETLNASTSAFTVSDFQLLYPIPLEAIDAINDPSIFPQNPGY